MKKDVVIIFRVSDSIKKELKEFCNKKGMSMSAVILRALYEYLERNR